MEILEIGNDINLSKILPYSDLASPVTLSKSTPANKIIRKSIMCGKKGSKI